MGSKTLRRVISSGPMKLSARGCWRKANPTGPRPRLDAAALAGLTGELTEHLSRPETFTLQPLLFHAWGRKPG